MKTILAPFIFALCGIAVTARAEPSSSYQIGFIGALTGPAGVYGTAARRGIELALESLPAESKKPTIRFEDDQFESKLTLSAYRSLQAGSDIVLSLGSAPSNSIAPIAERDHRVLLAWASDPRVSEGRKFVIRTYPRGQDEGRKIAEVIKNAGYRRITIVRSEDDYSNSVVDGFVKSIEPALVVYQMEGIAPAERDFRSYISKLRQAKADALFVCLNAGQVGLFARTASEALIHAPFFGCETFNDREEARQGPLAGSEFATIGISDEFRKRYLERYGEDRVLSGAAIYHDVMLHVVKVLGAQAEGETGSTSSTFASEQFVRRLIDTPFVSKALTGASFRSTENERFLEVPLTIRKVER